MVGARRLKRKGKQMARLTTEPPTRVDTLADLVGIAHTIETEAIRSYTRLAAEMRRRGEIAPAEAMEAMAREVDAHVAAVESWARRFDPPVPGDDRRSEEHQYELQSLMRV